MGTTTTTRVTPLLSIGDGGTRSVYKATALLSAGHEAVVADAKTAYDVLRYFGCSDTWANDRINYALTGDWPGRIG